MESVWKSALKGRKTPKGIVDDAIIHYLDSRDLHFYTNPRSYGHLSVAHSMRWPDAVMPKSTKSQPRAL